MTEQIELLLSASDLGAAYRDKIVFRNVSLSIQQGEILAIVGASGCGKTTLLKCLNLLHLPFEGTLCWKEDLIYKAFVAPRISPMARIAKSLFGFNSDGTDRQVDVVLHNYRRYFGFVFQEFNLWPDYTLWQNIAAPLVWGNLIMKKELKDRVLECAKLVQIDQVLHKYPNEVSGGQKQRAAIARALAPNPSVLLLDEITSSLDPDLVFEVLQTIEKLAGLGKTMVIVTHHMHFARRVSNRIALMTNMTLRPAVPSGIFFDSSDQEVRDFLRHFEDA